MRKTKSSAKVVKKKLQALQKRREKCDLKELRKAKKNVRAVVHLVT